MVQVQIQGVLYHTEPAAVRRTVEALANAVRVERRLGGQLGRVRFVYGDASETPVLDEAALRELRALTGGELELDYRFFGFNSGFGKGQNLLAEDSEADYLLLINPDVVVEPRFFIHMLAPMAEETVGLVEARQLPVEHQKDYDVRTLETPWAAFACVLVRTALFRRLGGLDAESFFMYCEDVDFSWRLRLLGYTIRYQPLAPVYHAKRLSGSGGWQPSAAELYYSALSALLLAHKWSAARRERELLLFYDASEKDYERRAAAEFRARQAAGTLPDPRDGKPVTLFTSDGYYAPNRFVL